jgi:hypothetical protein
VRRLADWGAQVGIKIDQVFAYLQVRYLEIAQPFEHETFGRIDPVVLTRTPSRLTSASANPSEHTDSVPRQLEFTERDIAAYSRRALCSLIPGG